MAALHEQKPTANPRSAGRPPGAATRPPPPSGKVATEDAADRTVQRLLDEWRRADLLTTEQTEAITAYHRKHHRDEERSRGFGRMVGIASTLGAVLVGAGILLVVASNWASFAPMHKSLMAIGVVVMLECAGYWVRFRTSFARTGEAVLFIGAVAYGGAVFLVAQAYNRPLDDPNLFLFWLIPVFPLAYVVRSRLLVALSILVSFGVIGYRLPDWAANASTPPAVLTTYILVGAALVSVGGVHGDLPSLRRFRPPWEWLGTVAILTVLFAASFRSVGSTLGSQWIGTVDGTLLALYAIAGVIAAAGVVARAALRHRFDQEVALTTALVGLAAVATAIFIASPFARTTTVFAVMNLLLLAALVALIVGGVVTGRQALLNVSFVVFGIAVISRYVEIGAGMFGTGTAMIVGGTALILLGVGIEVFRRRLVETMRHAEGAP